MIFLRASSWSTMFETISVVAVGVSETLNSIDSSGWKATLRSLARSLRQSAVGQGMDSASGSILWFCRSSRDCVSSPMASICSMEIILAESGEMMFGATFGAAGAAWVWAAGSSGVSSTTFSGMRLEERFSSENALRRICSASVTERPSSWAFWPSWKAASM